MLATGVFALAVTTSSFVLLVTGSRSFLVNVNVLGTAIHEAGHAAACCLTGGGVYQIEITGPESGGTDHWYTSRFSSIATTAAGYAAPPLAGLGAASLLRREHSAAVLAITVVAMLMILVVTRDLVTLGAVLAVGSLAFASLYWGPAWLQNWVGYTEAWLLLTSEIGGLANIVVNRFRSARPLSDDAESMAEKTHIPGVVWIAGWFALICWGLWNGAGILWP